VIETEHVEGKAGFLAGGERALVVDPGGSAAEGRAMAAAVGRLTRLPTVVLYTHGHWDHVRGGIAFKGCEAWCHIDAAPSVRTANICCSGDTRWCSGTS